MTRSEFEEEVAAMLRRRATDIEGDSAAPAQPDMATAGPTPVSGRRDRRNRWPAAILAVAAAALVGFGLLLWSRPSSSTETISSGAVAPAAQADPPTQRTLSPTARPAIPEPTGPPEPSAVPTSAAAAAVEGADGVEQRVPDPPLLLPGPPWEVQHFSSQLYGPPAPPGPIVERVDFMAATEEGAFGPVVWAYSLPDIDYRRVGQPGGTYRDQTLSDGRQVRIRDDQRPASVLMVFEAPEGAAVAIGYDVSDDDVVTIIEGLIIDEGAVSWQGGPLPQDLSPVEFDREPPYISTVNMSRGETEQLQITQFPGDQWQPVLNARTTHRDVSRFASPLIEASYVYGYDETSRDDPGAVFRYEGRFYVMRVPRWGPTDPHATEAEVVEILETFIEYDVTRLMDELGLKSRAEIYQEWIAATPLPPGLDLQWLLDGPPIAAEEEADYAHQVFTCAWAGEWVKTGDSDVLDQLAQQLSWPTALLLQERFADQIPPPPSDPEPGDAAPSFDIPEPFLYAIEQGDRLGTIATKFNVPIEAIFQANPALDPNILIAGELIRIPAAATATTGPPLSMFVPGIKVGDLTPGDTASDRATDVIRESCGFILPQLPPRAD